MMRSRAGLGCVLAGAGALFAVAASAQAGGGTAALLNQVVDITATSYTVAAPPAGNMAGQRVVSTTRNRAAGFIIDSSGIIVTNRHSVADATEIIVVLHDTTRLRAHVLATAVHTDIALLKVNAQRPLPTARFGDSERMHPGDPVLLIGNPLGQGSTVTSGIVSALDRNTEESGTGSFFQIDAALNRGNSGGPVFNADGEVVGIATALLSASGAEGSVGLGFATPSNDAAGVVRSLLESGEVHVGWIGARVERLTADAAAALGLPGTDGSIVVDVVRDSPAWRSGIAPGDVVLKVDGIASDTPRRLGREIAQSAVGASRMLTLWRAGGEAAVPVVVSEVPEAAGSRHGAPVPAPLAAVPDAYFGLVMGPATPELWRRLGERSGREGVAVAAVVPSSIADDHGIVAGAAILNAERRQVASEADVRDAIDAARVAGRAFAMLLVEDEQGLHWVALPFAPGAARR